MFDYRQWMGMVETLGDIHGLVVTPPGAHD